MYRVIIIFLLSFILPAVYSSEHSSIIRYPVQHQYNDSCGYYRPQISPDNLGALEKYSMNRIYNRDYPRQRLERLENLAFGSVQQGDLATRYRNVEEAILSRPSTQGRKKNILGNIADYFAGQTTGYTPSINNSYYPGFYPAQNYATQRYEQFTNGMFGGAYNLMNQNFGNGSAVRILP